MKTPKRNIRNIYERRGIVLILLFFCAMKQYSILITEGNKRKEEK